MAKKKRTSVSSRKYKHAQWIKAFAAIGSVISIISHAYEGFSFFEGGGSDITVIIGPIVGILTCLVILGSLEIINHDFVIKMTFFSLLVLLIIDAICGTNIGTFFIAVAVVIALIDIL